jgi:RNAse (barnase) inhibitor barstar
MTDDLTALLDGSRRSGVYRIGPGESSLAERLAAAGWRSVLVLEPFEDLDGFYDLIADGLGFPRYFGRNLDALWDSLTDLIDPTAVIIRDWNRFAVPQPEDWRQLYSVLEDRTQQGAPFAVLLTGPE